MPRRMYDLRIKGKAQGQRAKGVGVCGGKEDARGRTVEGENRMEGARQTRLLAAGNCGGRC